MTALQSELDHPAIYLIAEQPKLDCGAIYSHPIIVSNDALWDMSGKAAILYHQALLLQVLHAYGPKCSDKGPFVTAKYGRLTLYCQKKTNGKYSWKNSTNPMRNEARKVRAD